MDARVLVLALVLALVLEDVVALNTLLLPLLLL